MIGLLPAGERKDRRGDAPPLIIVALDGGDGALLSRWFAEGRLPALSGLARAGCWGDVTGLDLRIEHGLFLSLWSGRSCAEHGYHHYRHMPSGTYAVRPASGRDFDAPPFWAELAGTGARVAIVDAPETAPVPGLEGLQLSDWAVHEPRHPPAAIPEAVLDRARAVFGPREVIDQQPWNGAAADRRLLSRYLSRVARKGRLVRDLVSDGPFDLIVVGFGETHTGAHQFWSYRDQPERFGELAHGVRAIYEAVDREIGALLETVGEGANVVVFGGVGLVDSYPTDCILDTALERLGYLARRPPARKDLLRRLVPERTRRAIGARLPTPVQERLVAGAFLRTVDWDRTRAFNVPAIYTSMIRLNLKGREPEGVVEASEAEAVLDRLEQDLRALTDAADGRPVVSDVLRTAQALGPDRHPDLPDAVVFWRPCDRFFERVRFGDQEWPVERPHWFRSSFHDGRGWYAAAGPSVAARGRAEALEVADFAPLFRTLVGLEGGRRAARAVAGRA